MKTQQMHPHTVRWALVFLGLVVLTLVLLMAGPAAQDQPTPDAQTSGVAAPESTE